MIAQGGLHGKGKIGERGDGVNYTSMYRAFMTASPPLLILFNYYLL